MARRAAAEGQGMGTGPGPNSGVVLDAMEQPALLLDGACRIVHANAAACTAFGITEPRSCAAVFRCDAARQRDCPVPEVLAAGRPRTCTLELGGFRRGLRLTAAGAEHVLGLVATATSLAALPGEDADLLQTIFDASSDAVIACDRDHRVEFVNRNLVERTGVPASALIGRDLRTIWPAPGELRWDELSHRVLDGGETVRLPNLRYKGSLCGGTIWVDLTFAPRRDAAGAVVGSVTTARYLTEERRLATRLDESERRFHALFEKAPVGLLIIGQDRAIRVANQAMQRMVAAAGDLAGRRFQDLVAPEGRDALVAAFERVTRTGRRMPGGGDYRLIRHDGQPLHVHVRTADIDYLGEPCLLTAVLDVTLLKQLESQLAQAEKLAGLGTLAAGVAHEFNNVLAAIQGRAEILLRRPPAPARVEECCRAIVRHCRRGVEVIAEIATFAAARPARPQPLRWEEIVEEVLQSLQPRLDEEQVAIERAYRATRAIFADPGQMHQLVLNLVQNARDAVRAVPQRRIRVATCDREGVVELEVADSGIGMDETVRQRVFEPFFTTKTWADRGGGLATGLGLAIVYSVVRAHGGQIEVMSAPGRGARFLVALPAHDEPGGGGGAGGGGGGAPPGATRPLRVLIVDDDPDITEMMALALRTEGWTVHTSNRPEEAAALSPAVGYDVLIVDLMMPGIDGLEVLRRLRARGVTTPALLLTGRRGATEGADLAGLGVRRCLEKPIGLDALLAAITEVVEQAAGGAAR